MYVLSNVWWKIFRSDFDISAVENIAEKEKREKWDFGQSLSDGKNQGDV